MTRPAEIVEVHPIATATYMALRWIGDKDDPALAWMANRFGWQILGMQDSIRKGRCLMILGKNSKRYLVAHGEYVIALGANGSMRIATLKEYDRDYREASK